MKFIHKAKTLGTTLTIILGTNFLVGCGDTEVNGLDDNLATKMIIENPKSDVTGQVTDQWTGEPVVGAIVMIEGYDIHATTDEFGNYILKSVPANEDDQGVVLGTYRVSIDLRYVTSPVKMSDTTITNRYADMDTTGNTLQLWSGNTGIDATAVSGLTNTKNFSVGKSSTTLSGHVFGVDGTTPTSGIIVELWTAGGEYIAKTTSAVDDTATTTVDETGAFTFSGVEAGVNYEIKAMSTDNTLTNATTVTIYASENTASNLDVLDKVVLGYNDGTAPAVIAATPESGADLPATAAATFTWTFNEAIAQNTYRDSTNVNEALYQDISVQQTGTKLAGGVANSVNYTVAWSTDFTKLTVTVPVLAPAATYTASIAGLNGGGTLRDAAGNAATIGGGFQTINFTTNGGTDLSAVTPTVVLTSPALTAMTHNSATVNLDWPTVAGAVAYNIYRQTTVGAVDHGLVLIKANQTASNYTSTLPPAGTGTNFVGDTYRLVSNFDEAVSHAFFVTAVNANGDEGAMSSDAIVLKDGTKPTVIAAGACTTANGGRYGGGEITVQYNEPVIASEAETFANYTGLPAGSVAAEYDQGAEAVTFFYNAAVTCGTPTTITVTATAVHDVAGNELDATANTDTF